MAKAIVKYDNEINKLRFAGLTKSELNILFTIFACIREQGTNEIKIDFNEFSKLANVRKKDKKYLMSEFEKIIVKIMQIPINLKKDNRTNIFNICKYISLNPETEIIEMIPNEYFVEYFNNLIGNYTIFELQEITQLESKYSKNLYRLLKQFKKTGWAHFNDFENFKELIDIPENTSNKNVISVYIKKAIKELEDKNCFENLQYKLKKEKYKQGQPIKAIEFTFQAQEKDIVDGQFVFDPNRTDENGNYILVEQKREPERQKQKKTNKKTVENLKNNYNFEELEKELINSSKNNS